MGENADMIIKILCEELRRLQWKAEYEERRADTAEAELKAAKKKIDDLTF